MQVTICLLPLVIMTLVICQLTTQHSFLLYVKQLKYYSQNFKENNEKNIFLIKRDRLMMYIIVLPIMVLTVIKVLQ